MLRPAEVRALARRDEKHGRASFWLQPRTYEAPAFRETWDRIGHGAPGRVAAPA